MSDARKTACPVCDWTQDMDLGQPTLIRGATAPVEPCDDCMTWLLEHPDRCDFDNIDADDIRLLIYAAVAFNIGVSPKADRAPQDIERLAIAAERVGRCVGIEVRRGPNAAQEGNDQ